MTYERKIGSAVASFGIDVAAIQKAIDSFTAGGTVIVPAGAVLDVDAVNAPLKLRSNVKLDLTGATLRVKPNGASRYYAIVIDSGVSDVEVIGGEIVGDRSEHTYTVFGDYRDTHEWGMGVGVRGASRVTIRGTKVHDCTGDGFCVTGTDIVLEDCESDNNRRQGASLVKYQGVKIIRGRYTNSNGTKPGHGIDVEPDAGESSTDLLIDGAYVGGNAGDGIEIHDRNSNVTIQNCEIAGNKGNAIETRYSSTITMQNNRITGNGWDGIYVGQYTKGYLVEGNSMGGNRASKPMTARSAFTVTGTNTKTGRDLEISSTGTSGKVGSNTYLAQPLG